MLPQMQQLLQQLDFHEVNLELQEKQLLPNL
jgi:hypothetical protein